MRIYSCGELARHESCKMTTGPQNLSEKLQGSIISRMTKIVYLNYLSFIAVLRLSASALAQQTYIVLWMSRYIYGYGS